MGSEEGGTRPVLIVQNDTGNQYSSTVIAAPLTCRRKHGLPTHVDVDPRCGLSRRSTILCEQVRVLDKVRLRGYVGCLSDEDMAWVDRALAISVGLVVEGAGCIA